MALNGIRAGRRNSGGKRASIICREAAESSSSTTATDAFLTSITALFAGAYTENVKAVHNEEYQDRIAKEAYQLLCAQTGNMTKVSHC